MIISQTPLRISFVGGGTDFSDFYRKEKGSVLSTAIDKYIYIIIKKRFDDLIVLNYSKKEIVKNVNDLNHELIRESLLMAGIKNGIEITTLADIPSEGTGLGSSSSLTVGLLLAMYTYNKKNISAPELAKKACQIEIEICGKPIGKQDQYIAAYGGFREIIFNKNETVDVLENIIDDNVSMLESNLMLFYTGITRKSEVILKEQKKDIKNKIHILNKMKEQVPIMLETIKLKKYDSFGRSLHQAWEYKNKLSNNISNKEIDKMYDLAINNGALGGKISGAGGGGFLLLYVPLESQHQVRKVLSNYKELEFNFAHFGSRIIFEFEEVNK